MKQVHYDGPYGHGGLWEGQYPKALAFVVILIGEERELTMAEVSGWAVLVTVRSEFWW